MSESLGPCPREPQRVFPDETHGQCPREDCTWRGFSDDLCPVHNVEMRALIPEREEA